MTDHDGDPGAPPAVAREPDGSARLVSETIEVNLWRSLATRDGGEVIGDY